MAMAVVMMMTTPGCRWAFPLSSIGLSAPVENHHYCKEKHDEKPPINKMKERRMKWRVSSVAKLMPLLS